MRRYLAFILSVILLGSLSSLRLNAEDGYKLWLRYEAVNQNELKTYINQTFSKIAIPGNASTYEVIADEITLASVGMTGNVPAFITTPVENVSLLIGTLDDYGDKLSSTLKEKISVLGPEGYFLGPVVIENKKQVAIIGNKPAGALYGTFHLLRLMQSGKMVPTEPIFETPKIQHRILNHWDNLDRTVERGYAGFSIWDWHRLPDYIKPQYVDYARANASVGINGTVLTNVNANAFVLTPQYIEKVAALADVFRPYGIKVYLTARFSSPIEIGGLETADPLVPEVREWWKNKAAEIYNSIPDFGGFLVKANSEGQPGPQDYGRNHAEGANMLAEAVAPFGGIVMWRAFVYSHEVPEDRAKQANMEFEPLDGEFLDNVLIQVKNGAIDFQPREPFHPLFGSMPKTALAPELQITQEYLGQGTHLAYLLPMWKEALNADTYVEGEGTEVADIIDGSVYPQKHTAMAGVSNIGTDRNWTGHIFGQANWYGFGRLAWDHQLSSEDIAREWISLTFGTNEETINPIEEIMMASHEAVVNYMTPLGLHHIMGAHHHFGPAPWVDNMRPDWTSVYYHRADEQGIGFDRTENGSNALADYAPEIQEKWGDPETCPDKFLLWFHHLPWDYEMKSGRILWDELCLHYQQGVNTVREMKATWKEQIGNVDPGRYNQVLDFLNIQENEAVWWKDAVLLYFQQFSGMDFPAEIEKPKGTLKEYMEMEFPYAPGIRPEW